MIISCQNPQCAAFQQENAKTVIKHGCTKNKESEEETQRYRCKLCKKTFSEPPKSKQESYQCKKVKKNPKGTKGKSQIHREKKNKKLSVAVTPTGQRRINQLAKSLDISVSELIERVARSDDWLLSRQGFEERIKKRFNDPLLIVQQSNTVSRSTSDSWEDIDLRLLPLHPSFYAPLRKLADEYAVSPFTVIDQVVELVEDSELQRLNLSTQSTLFSVSTADNRNRGTQPRDANYHDLSENLSISLERSRLLKLRALKKKVLSGQGSKQSYAEQKTAYFWENLPQWLRVYGGYS